jgi:Ca-activated chloride channel family protein
VALMFVFHSPWWLALLPLVVLHVLWLRRDAGQRDGDDTHTVMLAHPQLGPVLDSAREAPLRRAFAAWEHAAIALLLVALAQPQSVGDWIAEAPQGRDIVLLLDTSVTMDIPDFELDGRAVTRLSVLKSIMQRFVEARLEDRFGIVVFGSAASTLVPPTFDRALVTAALARLAAGIAGENTAIGDALGLALKQVDTRNRARPALILVTDGDNTAGEMRPAEAVALAQRLVVPVYAVQVGGTAAPSATPSSGEPGLRDIALLTGGRYYSAGTAAALREVIDDIGELEQTIARPPTRRAVTEWYLLPLLAAAALFTLGRLRQTRSLA